MTPLAIDQRQTVWVGVHGRGGLRHQPAVGAGRPQESRASLPDQTVVSQNGPRAAAVRVERSQGRVERPPARIRRAAAGAAGLWVATPDRMAPASWPPTRTLP
jgi:hypothetical protein